MAKENQIAVEVVTKSDSIAGMREEISQFRKAMNEAKVGTEEFEAANAALTAAQDELRNVLKLGTKSVEEADDSYNTLTRTMAQLKEQWRAATDEVKRDELGKQIAGINQRLKDMDASVGDYFRNVGDYRNQIVGAFKDSTDALDHFLPGIGQVGTAMYDVVGAAESLSSILPIITTHAQGFVNALKSMKGALISTGIGIFIVALGAVIANWEKISELWRDTSPEDKAKAAIDDLNESLKEQSDILKSKNIEALEQYTIALNNAKGNIEAIKAAEDEYSAAVLDNRLKIAKASLTEAYEAESIAYAAYVKKQNEETTTALDAAKTRIVEIKSEIAQIENDIAKANAQKLADAQKVTTPKSTSTADPEEERLKRVESVGLKELKIKERIRKLDGDDLKANMEAQTKIEKQQAAISMEVEAKKAKAKQAAAQVAMNAMRAAAQVIGEETAVGKGLMVATALMETYQSANSAYAAMASIPFVGPALGIAAAAAAVASGLANVKQILSVKTDGSQNSMPSGGGGAAPAMVSAPAVIQQVPVTRTLTSVSEEERLNKMASDTRVYVVESDIRDAGKRAEVRESESSF